MTLQITMIFVSNFIEIGVPFLKKKLKMRSEEKNLKKQANTRSQVGDDGTVRLAGDDDDDLPYFEREMLAPVYGGVLEEYTELFIQYGYVTLFACAFPLSSFAAMVNNLLEVKVDGFKLLLATQRPKYLGAEDIGTWQSVLEFMSYLAVASNCAIICFTSGVFKGDQADRTSVEYQDCVNKCDPEMTDAVTALGVASNSTEWLVIQAAQVASEKVTECLTECACDTSIDTCYPLATRIWIFVVSEHFLLGSKILLAWLIPDKPRFVEEAEARAEVEKELENWTPESADRVDEETLRAWDQSVDTTDIYDNEGHK
jgi:hypothetical protein